MVMVTRVRATMRHGRNELSWFEWVDVDKSSGMLSESVDGDVVTKISLLEIARPSNKLVPFVPSIHAEPWHAVTPHCHAIRPIQARYVGGHVRLSAVADDDSKPADGTMAGIIGAVHLHFPVAAY